MRVFEEVQKVAEVIQAKALLNDCKYCLDLFALVVCCAAMSGMDTL